MAELDKNPECLDNQEKDTPNTKFTDMVRQSSSVKPTLPDNNYYNRNGILCSAEYADIPKKHR
jgi:hypothetical protein